MYTLSRTSRSGFTLIELMIAMVIFTVMSVMVMTVYLNTTHASRKLNATRQLTEVAREITERLSQDMREKGIHISNPLELTTDVWDSFDPTTDMWDTYDYTASGSEYLSLSGGTMYVYGSRTELGLTRCTGNTKTDNAIHCGLYLVPSGDNGANGYNLVDSFVPEESRKRVKIQDLKFYISGGEATTKKVTLIMTLVLMPRVGVPASMVENTKLHIQTTISERGWKKN